jgi:hypothetical protein
LVSGIQDKMLIISFAINQAFIKCGLSTAGSRQIRKGSLMLQLLLI